MINKKKGFTLAEVLITLGIIGVVAALSTPALIQHAASAKTGPSLARGISILAQGLEAYMQDYESNDMMGADPAISKAPQSLFDELEEHHIKMKAGAATAKTIYEAIASNTAYSGGDTTGIKVYLLNDKSAYFVPSTECNPKTSTRCPVYFLPVGWLAKKHIAIGEDAFELSYTNKGDVEVLGLDYGNLWTTSCSDPENMAPTENKASCGGRIVANGFKKDY